MHGLTKTYNNMNNVDQKKALEKRMQLLRKVTLGLSAPFIISTCILILATNRNFNENKLLYFVICAFYLAILIGLGIYKITEKRYKDNYPDE